MSDYTELKSRLEERAEWGDDLSRAIAAIESLEAEVARLRSAIMDRLHWVVLDGSHCDCGECVALVAALNGEAQP